MRRLPTLALAFASCTVSHGMQHTRHQQQDLGMLPSQQQESTVSAVPHLHGDAVHEITAEPGTASLTIAINRAMAVAAEEAERRRLYARQFANGQAEMPQLDPPGDADSGMHRDTFLGGGETDPLSSDDGTQPRRNDSAAGFVMPAERPVRVGSPTL